jgi:YgiT-type zinc finger domain-containing protein
MDERLQEEEDRRCWVCGGDYEPRVVTFCAAYEDDAVIVEGVPAEACKQCGEETYSWETSEVLEAVQLGKLQPHFVKQVPAFNYQSALESPKSAAARA